MAGGWRRAARTTVTTTICAALVTAVVPSAAAQPAAPAGSADPATLSEPLETVDPAERSEERRVGKECRSRRWQEYLARKSGCYMRTGRGRQRSTTIHNKVKVQRELI